MQLDPGGGSASPAAASAEIAYQASASTQTPVAEPIGAPLENARAQLASVVDRLAGVLGEHAAPLLNEARRQLAQRDCRIAVIGQVKAGKSTFINALIKRPELLPTNVNPWTAVVCSLHFRTQSAPPDHAAIFHLFSVDEWQQLAEGGGRLRELTQHLIPGFQPELLRAQLEVMRKRAEKRLGNEFEALLGKSHKFKDLTPELIADYVSAGDENALSDFPHRRIHSDITRAADLYFSDSPFAFPITLIDTPGTNDPFLVRDEITRRSLENPDIYVFVISALQPLSVSDIAMLRLLNGLHKDRIIVFINRTDQLPCPPADAPAIKAAVEKRLRLQFPSLDIPVICGSARLGNLIIEGQGAVPCSQIPAAALAIARADLPQRPIQPHSMEASSGMREVAAAITNMMCASGVAMLLRQIAVCLAELVKTAEVTDRAEITAIEKSLIARLKDAQALRTRIAEEERSLALFEQRANALGKSFREVGDRLNEIVAQGSGRLHSELREIVSDFAQGQTEAIYQLLPNGARSKAWHCDVMPLRERLEVNYVAAIERVVADLARVEQFLYPHLKLIVTGLLPEYEGDLLEAPAWSLAQFPSTAPLTKLVALDFGTSWWKRWLTTSRVPGDHAMRVRRLIEEEFFRDVDELVQEAEGRLKGRVGSTIEKANAIVSGLRMGIDQRRSNLAAELELLNGSGDEASLEQYKREQKERASNCTARRTVYARALDELARTMEALDTMQCAA